MAPDRHIYLYLKRALDIVFCGIALPILLPLLGVIAIIIKFSDGGPVLYRGLRTGRHGALFRILKFRTMVVDAEKMGGGTTALNDPRVLPVGRLLRRYKLDELPQIFNVLTGEMSLVGPRPELPQYTAKYSREEQDILAVRPGITDFSSIEFSSLDEVVGAHDVDRVFEETVFPRKNRLRLEYVRTCSLLVDVKILALTIRCLAHKMVRR